MTNNSYSAMANSPPLFAQNLPVGWRFGPTDQELVAHYLKRKRRGDPIDGSDIVEVIKFCNYNPWDLPGLSKCKSTDKEWFFFFYLREYHNNSGQAKRRAGNGYWKITGDPRSVTPEESDEEIGTKRTLVFHNPEATCWVMHEYEYTAELDSPVKGNYVLCKLKEKPNKKKKAVKRSKKVEPSCQKSRAKKKARKGKPSNLDPLDFEKQNPSKSTGTSSSTEGVWSSLLKSPDFDNQNQSEKTDLSPLKYDRSSYIASNVGETTFQEAQSQYKGTDVPTPNYQNSMLTSNSQEAMLQNQYDITEKPILEDNFTWMASDGREAKFPEINPQLLDELIAYYELQDSLNSASEQPIHTKES
ncbi:NAC domain-containing protein 71 isoform X2 [Jatropha curcas]|uniref:NAC domain-containing protein 71 isoform X2 n=1 Tax=Jatropha curcas TaxID=180498 RepID=UPI0009D68B14|nr:NAC domain-containing protein 71 isoform X2 [Jatropha curcas]